MVDVTHCAIHDFFFFVASVFGNLNDGQCEFDGLKASIVDWTKVLVSAEIVEVGKSCETID